MSLVPSVCDLRGGMSIFAHDWIGAFHLYAGFMSPLAGLGSEGV